MENVPTAFGPWQVDTACRVTKKASERPGSCAVLLASAFRIGGVQPGTGVGQAFSDQKYEVCVGQSLGSVNLGHFIQGELCNGAIGCRHVGRQMRGVHVVPPQRVAFQVFVECEMRRVFVVLMQIIVDAAL